MNILTTIKEWRDIRARYANNRIGFVPTMGHLHQGHLTLCDQSVAENDVTVASIFINPTQFNQASDFDAYPRTLEQDAALLAQHNVDYLFAPTANEMYPDQYQVQVNETELSTLLEGAYRPGHFAGMLTVVLRLFNIIQPTNAYFGEKDYQQALLIKKMVASLFLPLNVVTCATVRDHDGLALSSRNSRLQPEQRAMAAHFPRLLQQNLSAEEITQQLESLGFKVDYIADQWNRRLGAVWIDNIRLIDNITR